MVNNIYSFQYIILFICTIVSVNRKSGRWGIFFDSVYINKRANLIDNYLNT